MMVEYFILAGCLLASSIQAYNIGVRVGATGMIDSLMEGGTVDIKTGITTILIEPEEEHG